MPLQLDPKFSIDFVSVLNQFIKYLLAREIDLELNTKLLVSKSRKYEKLKPGSA